jgi:hypothetical protein
MVGNWPVTPCHVPTRRTRGRVEALAGPLEKTRANDTVARTAALLMIDSVLFSDMDPP